MAKKTIKELQKELEEKKAKLEAIKATKEKTIKLRQNTIKQLEKRIKNINEPTRHMTTQCKIIVGALTMKYIEENVQGKSIKDYVISGLKKDMKEKTSLKKNKAVINFIKNNEKEGSKPLKKEGT